MRFSRVRIESMAWVEPPVELTSAAIEQTLAPLYERLRLPAGRLELMTGIRARRFWEAPMAASAASAEAGRAVLARSRVPRERLGLLLHCGVCRDRLEPATAAYVHSALGLPPQALFLDVSNACLGFLNGLVTAAALIESGQIEAALVCSGENGRPLLDQTLRALLDTPQDRQSIKPFFANLTIGAGAAAFVLCREDLATADAPRLLGGVGRADSAANTLCQGDTAGADALMMLTEAEALLEAGLRLARDTWEAFLAARAATVESFARVVCHQVGRTHQRKLLETLGIDPARDYTTYQDLGNVGSVSLPLTLAKACAEGVIRGGDRVALLGIGSGLSSLMLEVQA